MLRPGRLTSSLPAVASASRCPACGLRSAARFGTSVALERAAGAGAGVRWAGVLAAVGLAVAALLLQTVLSPFQAAFTELVSRRVDGECARRLMRAAAVEAPVELLEQPDVLDKLSDSRQGLTGNFETPGAAVAGVIALVARYAQLAGAVVIVGITLGPLAGLAIGAVALVARFGQRGSAVRWSAIVKQAAPARRKMLYILDSGSAPATAKEIRVLGTLAWWRARGRRDGDASLRPLAWPAP